MKRRTDLYELIRAMSKSEKRYFTIDAQKSGRTESRYLELFQAINDMTDEDESALQTKFGKNLSADKNYLYEAILRSMRDYRSTNSLAARIREMILDAKYLHERGLYDQCEERLSNAKGLATQLDDNLVLLEIIKEERRLARERRPKNYEAVITGLSDGSSEVLHRIADEVAQLGIYDELVNIVLQKFTLNDKQAIAEIRHKFYPRLTGIDPEQISSSAQRRFFQCWALYSQLVGNSEDVFYYYQKVIDWWDRHPVIKEEEFNHYVVDISNYLHGYAAKGQFQHFPKLIEKMEMANPRNLHDKSTAFQKISTYKLMYFINTRETRGIPQFLRTIEKGLSAFYISERGQLVLLFNTAFLLFLQEDYAECVKWCEKIFLKKKVASRLDIQRGARLLYLISEYEIDEADGPEKALRSVSRYLQVKHQRQDKNEFESLILAIIQKLVFAPLMEKKHIYQEAATSLEEFGKAHKAPLGLDELFTIWINGKLNSRKTTQRSGAY